MGDDDSKAEGRDWEQERLAETHIDIVPAGGKLLRAGKESEANGKVVGCVGCGVARMLQPCEDQERFVRSVFRIKPAFRACRLEEIFHKTITVRGFRRLRFESDSALKFGKTLQFAA
jgi:hypothetical protein